MAYRQRDLVSVVIPCFNAERYVIDAIESATAQTYPFLEIVLVDDGSTDSTLDILSRFDGRATVLTGVNQGACAARNRGLTVAQGRWIQFLDADDLLHPRKVELQIQHAQSLSSRCSSICLGREQSGSGFLHSQYQRRLGSGRDIVDFLLHGVLATPAPLHRREALESVGGFDENLVCAQEYDLHLRLACKGWEFDQLYETLFTVRRQPESVSSDSLKVLRQMPNVLRRVHALLDWDDHDNDIRRRSLAVAMARTGYRLKQGGADLEGQSLIEEALLLDDDAIAQAWTRPWRPLVRLLGAELTGRIYRRFRTR